MKYSIIIVVYKAEDKLYKCLDSLAEHIPDGSAEIILVDNNEAQDFELKSKYIYKLLKDQINGYCSVEVVKAGGNIGYAAGANLGVTLSEGRYLVFVNPDTIVFDGWYKGLTDAMGKYPEVGAVGPISNFVAGYQNANHYLKVTDSQSTNARVALNFLENLTMETDMLIGFFLMTKKSVFDEVGGFDPDLFLGCDDLDYSLKLKDKGYKMIISLSSYVHHFGHESFKCNPKSESLTKQTEEIFCRKLHEKYSGNVPEAVELWGVPMINTQINHEKVKLSVCMIVRGSWSLNQKLIKELGFADEIIIVGTAGYLFSFLVIAESDGLDVKKIKSDYFPWNDSFADARNHALSLCTGDWVLWIDDDDEIPEETGEMIRAIIDKPGPITKAKGCHFALKIKDIGVDGRIFYCAQPRLFPNLPGMKWKGRVHENYLDAAAELGLMPVVVDNIEIIHTGYANHETNKAKSERNIRLLEMEDDSDEKFFHLGKQYQSMNEFDKAIGYYKKALELTTESNTDGRDHLRYSIALCYYQNGGFDGKFKENDTLKYLKENKKPDALFLYGEWFYFNGFNDMAAQLFNKYLDLGSITDVRGTHQDSFREHALKRLEAMNEPAV